MNNLHRFKTTCLFSSAVLLMATLLAGCNNTTVTDSSAPDTPEVTEVAKVDLKSVPEEINTGEKKTEEKKIGVLLVSHGSHSKQWREMLTLIGDVVKEDVLKGDNVINVKSAFMEYTEPSIASQLKTLDKELCTDIIIVPLLLAVSSHSFDDIPTIAGQKEDKAALEELKLEGIEVYKPKAKVTMAPLLDFPAVLEKNVVRRVKKMSEDTSKEGVVLVAYGSTPFNEEWEAMLKDISAKLKDATGIDEVRHSYCGHIVEYKTEPTEKALKEILDKKENAIVVPVLVAVSENFQGRIIGGAIKNVKQDGRVKYLQDAILPDENINAWVIDISRKLAKDISL